MERFDELLSEYLDGHLDGPGREEFARLVESDPERLRLFVDLVRENRILEAELGEMSEDEFARRVLADLEKDKTRFIRAVMTDVRGSGGGEGGPPPPPRAPRPAPRPRRKPGAKDGPGSPWLAWGAVAAAAAIVLVVILFAFSGEPEPSRPDRRREQAKIEKKRMPGPTPEKETTPPTPPKTSEPPVAPKPETQPPSPPAPAPESKPEPQPPTKPESPAPPAPLPEKKPDEKPTLVEVATLERIDGDVTLAKAPAQVGQKLVAGFSLETADERSGAALRLADGSKVELHGPSRFRDVSEGPTRRFALEGIMTAEIAKLPAEQPLLFVTAQAESRIVGTKLRIETLGESTRLDVTEGKVKYTRLKDRMSVDVVAGHYSIAAPNVPLTSRLARVGAGLVALYTFKEGKGPLVHDVSRAGAPIDLRIENESAARWSPKGLTLAAPTLVASAGPATRIVQACKASNEITIEAWFRPGTLTPASKDGRIVTLSGDTTNQDFMLGQDELKGPTRTYFVRLRTTATDPVGKPALASPDGTATAKLSHVVYTRAAAGATTITIDGAEVARSNVAGTLATWGDFRLGLGNEMTADRPWLGEFHLVAIYSRALAPDEVRQNHKAGVE